MADLMVFSGNATPALAQKIAEHLVLPLGKATVSRFSDGETFVDIKENVRGKDVFVIQSTSAPTNDHIMELLLMVDALHRSSAGRITSVIPYFGYSRQDRRVRSSRVPISAKVVADVIVGAGVDRVLTVDLHADQIQGFFNIPVDNLYATPILVQDITLQSYTNPIVISPDVGGVIRARAIAKRLNKTVDLAIIDKRRPSPNEAQVMHVIGHVAGRTCIIIDDLVDTGGTLCKAAHALKEQGALKTIAYCTHPVLSGHAIQNIEHSEIDELVVTNTIPLSQAATVSKRIRVLDISQFLAEAIRRVSQEVSVSSLFNDEF